MTPQDLFHNLARRIAIAPQSLGATGSGGKVSKIIDTAGFDRKAFLVEYGTVTATGATVVASVKDAAATGGPFNAVTGGLLLGSGSLGATTARVSAVSKNTNRLVEYLGLNRYLEITLAPSVSGAIIASATALLANARSAPVT